MKITAPDLLRLRHHRRHRAPSRRAAPTPTTPPPPRRCSEALIASSTQLDGMTVDELLAQRARRYRAIGAFSRERRADFERHGRRARARRAGERALEAFRTHAGARVQGQEAGQPGHGAGPRHRDVPAHRAAGRLSRARAARRGARRRYRRRRALRLGHRSDRRHDEFRLGLAAVRHLDRLAGRRGADRRLHLGTGRADARAGRVPRAGRRRGAGSTISRCASRGPSTSAARSWPCPAATCARFAFDGPDATCRRAARALPDPRTTGSCTAELVLIASGALRAGVFIKPSIWDVAAGALIVREAGGDVLTWKDGQWQRFRAVRARATRTGQRRGRRCAHWGRPLLMGAPDAVERLTARMAWHPRLPRPLQKLIGLGSG